MELGEDFQDAIFNEEVDSVLVIDGNTLIDLDQVVASEIKSYFGRKWKTKKATKEDIDATASNMDCLKYPRKRMFCKKDFDFFKKQFNLVKNYV